MLNIVTVDYILLHIDSYPKISSQNLNKFKQ